MPSRPIFGPRWGAGLLDYQSSIYLLRAMISHGRKRKAGLTLQELILPLPGGLVKRDAATTDFLPLIKTGSNTGLIMVKDLLSARSALDIRNNALRQLNEELGLAWNAYNNATQQVPIAQQYVDRSTKVRTSYQQQFSLGERTLLDLLDSENELFTAQQRLAQIKSLHIYTQYRIKADMGQLLKSQGVVAPMASVVQNDIKPSVNLPGMN